MCFFKKKTEAQKVKEDRELIATNSTAVDALIVLTKNEPEQTSRLKNLQEALKYLIPSDDPKVYGYDKSIKNRIDDLRIVLSKTDGSDSKKVSAIFSDIETLIAERRTKL